jgi:ubiquitin-activating enzyme E1 C
MQAPPQLEETTRPNLVKPLKLLLSHGEEVVVTDTKLPFELRFVVLFKAVKGNRG